MLYMRVSSRVGRCKMKKKQKKNKIIKQNPTDTNGLLVGRRAASAYQPQQ